MGQLGLATKGIDPYKGPETKDPCRVRPNFHGKQVNMIWPSMSWGLGPVWANYKKQLVLLYSSEKHLVEKTHHVSQECYSSSTKLSNFW